MNQRPTEWLPREARVVVSGYLMAGGRSTRFGRDKALVEIGGAPMLERMIRLLGTVTADVRVVTRKGGYEKFGVEMVADRWPGEGPLGGIITALLATAGTDGGRDWNLIISCDMPFLTHEWLTYLLGRALASEAHVVLPLSGSGPEPLCACWRTQCVEILLPAFERGVRKVMDGVKQLKSEVLDEADWKRFDSAGRLFWNMNTPADYHQARRILETDER